MKPKSSETILFAVIGMSPAVLTETVWALAHEKPAILPDRVIAVTTTYGRDAIRRELFSGSPCVWDRLGKKLKAGEKLRFGETGDDIRVFTTRNPRTGRSIELEDLRSQEDNAAAADFILEQLRALTENPDTRIIASLAGGRKTMGALLYGAMTLIGRETDRMTHVLVDPALEQKRDPKFYFPTTAQKRRGLELADIPFVPLRNRFTELGHMPGSFRSLVQQYAKVLKQDRTPSVRLTSRGVAVDEVPIPLTQRERWTLEYLIDLNQRKQVPIGLGDESTFHSFLQSKQPDWAAGLIWSDDLKRALSSLRRKLLQSGTTWKPGVRQHALSLPPFRLLD